MVMTENVDPSPRTKWTLKFDVRFDVPLHILPLIDFVIIVV